MKNENIDKISAFYILKHSVSFVKVNIVRILIAVMLLYLPFTFLQFYSALNTTDLRFLSMGGTFTKYVLNLLSTIYLIYAMKISFDSLNTEIKNESFWIRVKYIAGTALIYKLVLIAINMIINFMKYSISSTGLSLTLSMPLSVLNLLLQFFGLLILQEAFINKKYVIDSFKLSAKDVRIKIDTSIILFVLVSIILAISALPMTFLISSARIEGVSNLYETNLQTRVVSSIMFSIIEGLALAIIVYGKCLYFHTLKDVKTEVE